MGAATVAAKTAGNGPLALLVAQGFEVLAKNRKALVYADPVIKIGGEYVRLNFAAYRAMGTPTHVVVVVKGAALALVPATQDEPEAYRLNEKNPSLASTKLLALIQRRGWQEGVYPAQVERGVVLIEQEKRQS